jgi:hypothetical protein
MNYMKTLQDAGILPDEVQPLMTVSRQTLYQWDAGVQPRSIYVERTVNKLIGLVKEATDKGLLPLVEVADAQRLTEITTAQWHQGRIVGWWELCVAGDYSEDDEVYPSHWMPLPDPPSQLPQNNC